MSGHFASRGAFDAFLRTQSALPKGFRVGRSTLKFPSPVSGAPMDMRLTAITTEQPSSRFAAVFTRNRVVGAPIIVCRRRVANSTVLSGIIINNRVANVAATDGVAASERVSAAAARALGLHGDDSLLPLSTGVIGWPLPVDSMIEAMPALAASVKEEELDAFDAAEAIMTTDMWPKLRRETCAAGGATVLGIAKGAGMVEPNMATMLSVILTDVSLSKARLQQALEAAVNARASFNSCSVDSDTSTSDAVIVLSSGTKLADSTLSEEDVGNDFEAALTRVCVDLASDVVRNGEGVTHVMRVHVKGAPSDFEAHQIGKAVVNSPLLKCAVAADDPNVGRLAAAVGKACMQLGVELDQTRMRLTMGTDVLMSNGAFVVTPDIEQRLIDHMQRARLVYESPTTQQWPVHENNVEIGVDLGLGGVGEAIVVGGDLTHEYVDVNSSYRT